MSSKIPKTANHMKTSYGLQKNVARGGYNAGTTTNSKTRSKISQQAEPKQRENLASGKNAKSPPAVRRRNPSPLTASSPSPKALHRPVTNLLRKSPISSSLRDLSTAVSTKPSKRPTGPDRRGISEIKRFVL